MKDIYFASCVENGGIYHYKLEGGAFTLAEITPMDSPMYMVIEDRKMYIVLRAPFADCQESGVVVYDLDDTGKLVNPSPTQSTLGTVGCHILVEQGAVYCANYTSGSAIKLPDTLVTHQGSGVHPVRQTAPHCHFVGLTPDKKYVCVTDLGLDTIFLYDRDMQLHSQAKVPAGHGVRHLIFSEDGKWLFAANELESTLSVFSYHEGQLNLLDTCRLLPEDFTEKNLAAAIRLRNGKIYISNRGYDSISQVSFANGKLTLEKNYPCGGKAPRDFCFLEKYAISTNQDSDTVTILDTEQDFALLETLPIPAPICVCVATPVEISQYDGEGYQPQIDYNGWRVAVANYGPDLERSARKYMERHMETDEVFVLLQGKAGLLIGTQQDALMLETGKLYNVKRRIWHSLFMEKGAKVLIVENTDTGKHNTEYCDI